MPSRVGMPAIEQSFIEAIRTGTTDVGALLILDEVISFRLAHGGAQSLHNIEPDLTALSQDHWRRVSRWGNRGKSRCHGCIRCRERQPEPPFHRAARSLQIP